MHAVKGIYMRDNILVYFFVFIFHSISPTAAGAICKISVSIPPQKFLVERIGGPEVTVNTVLGAGSNPLTYSACLDDVDVAAGSTAYFVIGFPFESRLASMLVSRYDGLWVVQSFGGTRHRNRGVMGQRGTIRARSRNQHVWMSPDNVRHMIEVFARWLSEEMPEKKELFYRNAALLDADVERMDREVRQRLDGLPEEQRFLLDLTPSWHYFTTHYELKVYYASQAYADTSNEAVAACASLCRANGIKTVLAPPEYPAAQARALAQAIKGKVILIDPLETDWFDTMDRASAAMLAPVR